MASGNHATKDSVSSTDLSDRVEAVIEPYLNSGEIPGISVAIVKHGHVALAQGYGVANVATGQSAQATTPFEIGSVTKTFTALGVLLLYQESQGTSHPIDLNAPIRDYLHNTPNFKLPREWSHVTTMELLAMTSGIPNLSGSQPWQTQVQSMANEPLQFTPGTKSFYSNTNFDLLGEMIEQRTGESYANFLQSRILAPLGMSETEALGHSTMVPHQAVGYNAPKHGRWSKANLQPGQSMYAADGVVSTAQDMATYMAALLGGQILNPSTYALMWSTTPTPEYKIKPVTSADRGLGWDTVVERSDGTGVAEVTKGGSVAGYTSEIILSPSAHHGVFVSYNTNYAGSANPHGVTALQIAQAVYDASRGHD